MRSNAYFFLLLILVQITALVTPYAASNTEQKKSKVILVALGDSLTEGYGINKDMAYPTLVEKMLKDDGYSIEIFNAGISGSTSAGAVSRLRWFLRSQPTHLLLALGANDGLRGVEPKVTKKNLKDTIRLAKENKIEVYLAGMKMPTNYGEKYTKEFESLFAEVAKEENVRLLPFLLEGVAAVEKLNQTDGIHPNEAGHKIMAKLVYEFLLKNLPPKDKP